MHARRDERECPLPGDEILPDVEGSLTHAVTIARPRAAVWPWLVQMGAWRAGWYSYDFIDNERHHSEERIVPELQEIDVGTVMPWLPGATEGFSVMRVERPRCIVLGAVPPEGGPPPMTWAFVLEEPRPGTTRLIARARARAGYKPPFGLPRWTLKTVVPWGHLIMQRKQLLGIARRAEAMEYGASESGTRDAGSGRREARTTTGPALR
ncbi:MAG TPA: hypothetical protein VFJ74_04095 [Gemmatimonadaceae bacterium]|nr:hypothetical protein [Gemmatimonadaceae bacterium]